MTISVEYNQLDPLLRATGDGQGDVNSQDGWSPFPGVALTNKHAEPDLLLSVPQRSWHANLDLFLDFMLWTLPWRMTAQHNVRQFLQLKRQNACLLLPHVSAC